MKRASWTDYQKDIADDNYYYARSCIRQNFFPGSEKAFLNILSKDLGRNIFDDPLHTSCTGIGYHADIVPLQTIMTVVARQFALMSEAGYGKDYKYAHDYPEHYVKQQYLPDVLKDRVYYHYGENKTEQAAKAYWDKIKKK